MMNQKKSPGPIVENNELLLSLIAFNQPGNHMLLPASNTGPLVEDILEAHVPPGGLLGRGHKGLYNTINNSLHFHTPSPSSRRTL